MSENGLDDFCYDVAIVGMGPVGASAAIHMAHLGLDVAIFEKEAEIYPLPRAVSIDGEIIRAFQSIGRGEELENILQPIRPDDRAGFADADRNWLFGVNFTSTGPNGWPPSSQFFQPELDRYLRRVAETYSGIKLFLGESVDQVDQVDQIVKITSQKRTLKCKYLIACDGASSPIRKMLDIDWHDLGYDHDWLVVDVEMIGESSLPHEVLQVCDPNRLHTFVAAKDPYRRWEFRLNPHERAEDLLEEETIKELLDSWTPRSTYRILRKAVYQFHAAVASRWRVGRIFLAGDAAHQMPPFLGQGMNSGIRDVLNLAWKLKLVLSGRVDESLLTTYEEERLPHSEDFVQWSVEFGNLMEHLADAKAAERVSKEPPTPKKKQRSAGYGQGRHAPPLRSGLLLLDQVSDDGSTGYLFSQPTVQLCPTETVRLDELLGRGFALITQGDVEFDKVSSQIIEEFDLKLLDVSKLEVVSGRLDRSLKGSECVLIRPDRYIFGHSSPQLTPDNLLLFFRQALIGLEDK